MSKSRVYLAGPDVFFSDPKSRAEWLKTVCTAYELEGVFPLDVEIDQALSKAQQALQIFNANVQLIKCCRGVLANMTPFRGPSVDVGTAWEMGFAYGQGLPVVGYTTDLRDYVERVTPDGYVVEDFGGMDNLMLTESAIIFMAEVEGKAFRQAVAAMARHLRASR